VDVPSEDAVAPLLARVLEAGARVDSVTPRRQEFETLFVDSPEPEPEAAAEA